MLLELNIIVHKYVVPPVSGNYADRTRDQLELRRDPAYPTRSPVVLTTLLPPPPLTAMSIDLTAAVGYEKTFMTDDNYEVQ